MPQNNSIQYESDLGWHIEKNIKGLPEPLRSRVRRFLRKRLLSTDETTATTSDLQECMSLAFEEAKEDEKMSPNPDDYARAMEDYHAGLSRSAKEIICELQAGNP